MYTGEEANAKLAEHRDSITRAEAEIRRLQDSKDEKGISPESIEGHKI